MKRDHGNNSHHGASSDTSRASTCNGSANDEGHRVRGRTTDGGTNLEEQDAHKERPSQVIKVVDSTKHQLERRRRDHVRRTIPADVTQAVEVVGDLRDGGRDDGAVEGDEEHGDKGREHDGPKLERLGLVVLLGLLGEGRAFGDSFLDIGLGRWVRG